MLQVETGARFGGGEAMACVRVRSDTATPVSLMVSAVIVIVKEIGAPVKRP